MKGFVLLAALLLVPSMAYFQKLSFAGPLRESLRSEVEKILVAEGVEGATVRMDWLDAMITGDVESEERRLKVAEVVDAVPGVRVPRNGNRLRAQGWLEISREKGKWTARGVLPREFDIQLPEEARLDREEIEVRRSSYVVAPAGAFEWGEFLDKYFDGPGDRSVMLREGRLLMQGDATVGLRSDWLAQASGVVGKESVDELFTLYPSVYHMPGYQPVTLTGTTELQRLRGQLQFGAVVFDPGVAEVPAPELGKVSAVATAILTVGDRVRYAVGGHPEEGDDAARAEDMALRRAEAVVKLLLDYGVLDSQLEAMVFGRGSQGSRGGRVEVLVK